MSQTGHVNGCYWFTDSGIQPSEIDSTYFTHLFCAFANLDPETGILTIPPVCETFSDTVRERSSSVIVILSIGGGNASSQDFNTMASQPETRQAFIESSIDLARRYNFDGLDLDWENQTTAEEMDNLAILLVEWRAAVNVEASGANRLILCAALFYGPNHWSGNRFPVEAIADNLDWVNVMAYDFYAPNRDPNYTRGHAVLYDPTRGVCGSKGIDEWITAGVPAQQLVLGLPYYGYTWKLVDPDTNGLLAPAAGYDYTIDPTGTPTYRQISEFVAGKGVDVRYDADYVTNYCSSETTWVGYDDTDSISSKVIYAKELNLLGYFAWHAAGDNDWTLSRIAMQTWEQ